MSTFFHGEGEGEGEEEGNPYKINSLSVLYALISP